MHSVYDNIKAALSLQLATYTAAQDGQDVVDTKGFNSAKVVITAGAVDTADGNETYVFNVQESDTGSGDWSDVTDADNVVILTAPITASDTQAAIRVEGLGTSRKRYLRVHLAAGGTTPSIVCEAHFELGVAFSNPVE